MLPGYRLTVLEETISTNSHALDLAEAGAADRSVVMARAQTGGRGRSGRRWISAQGNLYCSYLLRPDKPLAQWPGLAFVAALSVADLVDRLVGEKGTVRCKWPNDVLVDGRKIAGILLETGGDEGRRALVMGIGINLAHHPEILGDSVTSVCTVTGAAPDPVDTLCDLTVALEFWRLIWEREGFAAIRAAWLERAHDLGRPVRVRVPGSDTYAEGLFQGLDETGALVLRTPAGDRLFHAGEVFAFDEEIQPCS